MALGLGRARHLFLQVSLIAAFASCGGADAGTSARNASSCSELLLSLAGPLPPGKLAYIFVEASDESHDASATMRSAFAQPRVVSALASARYVHLDLGYDMYLSIARQDESGDDETEAYLTRRGENHADVQVRCGIEKAPMVIVIDASGRQRDRLEETQLPFNCKYSEARWCAAYLEGWIHRVEANK